MPDPQRQIHGGDRPHCPLGTPTAHSTTIFCKNYGEKTNQNFPGQPSVNSRREVAISLIVSLNCLVFAIQRIACKEYPLCLNELPTGIIQNQLIYSNLRTTQAKIPEQCVFQLAHCQASPNPFPRSSDCYFRSMTFPENPQNPVFALPALFSRYSFTLRVNFASRLYEVPRERLHGELSYPSSCFTVLKQQANARATPSRYTSDYTPGTFPHPWTNNLPIPSIGTQPLRAST